MLSAALGQSGIGAPIRASRRRAQYAGQAFAMMDVPNWAQIVNVVLTVKGAGYISAQMPDGTAIGGNQRGAGAVDLQISIPGSGTARTASQVASGANSFAAGVANTASGQYSVALGYNAVASGTGSFAMAFNSGFQSNASGQGCFAFGYAQATNSNGSYALGFAVTSSGIRSCAFGDSLTASGDYSLATGTASLANKYGQRAHASGSIAAAGDAQSSTLIARAATSNATPTNVFLDGSSARLVIPANTTWKATVEINASTNTAGNLDAQYERKVRIRRGTTAGSTVVTSIVTIGTDSGSNAGIPPVGWAIAITADTTNGALDIQVTGAAATNIRWVCVVTLVEVGFP